MCFPSRRSAARLLAVSVALLACGAPPAVADNAMETIVQDDTQLLHRSDAEVQASMAQLAQMGVDRVRLTAGWSVIAPEADSPTAPSFDATDPAAYPPHAWDNLDRAVRDAAAQGLEVDIDVAFWAPLWATADTVAGRTRDSVDPARFADFARAVARRYSGAFRPRDERALPAPAASADASLLDRIAGIFGRTPAAAAAAPAPIDPLPAVDMFTIWNEPNLGGFLKPQWTRIAGRWQPKSPHLYRRLVAAAYPAIKAIDPRATVLVGGTSSTGSGPGSSSVAPLRFIRELACVDARLRPLTRADCRDFHTVPGDGFAHHPYSLMKSPGQVSSNPDWATISELPRLTHLLAQLVDRGRLSPALRDVWLTEFGYESNDQVKSKRFSSADQARFLAWSEYLAARTPHVRSFAQFLLRDTLTDEAVASPGGRAFGSWQSGLLNEDGAAKPAAESFAATLWAQSTPSRRRMTRDAGVVMATMSVHLRAARAPTPVQIERQIAPGTWVPVPGGAGTTDAGGRLLLRVPSPAGATLRLTWQTAHGWESGGATAVQALARPARHARRS